MRAKYAKGIRLPGWLFLVGMSLYVELLLYFWTAKAFVPGRLAAIVLFALAFGTILGLIAGFFRPKAEKWITVVFATVLAVLCLLEFFIQDAYQVFMPLISVVANAEGVATGYTQIILSLVGRNLWRIALVLLPVILFALFSKGTRCHWQRSCALLAAAVLLYGAGIGMVHLVGLDTAQLSAAANFDGTVRSFGLSMGMVMDLSGGAAVGDNQVHFETPEFDPLPVETTQPEVSQPEVSQPEESQVAETLVATEPPVVYEPHSYGLDFAALAEAETNGNIASVHQYLATLTPDMENEYTGLFAGKNLILITAEAFTAEVIDPELTPTLYRMANEGIRFTDYYQPLWGCGTTGGEFANLLSIAPFGGTTSMQEALEQNLFLTMGNQLQKQGYSSGAFHNNDHTFYSRHETHPALGYDTFFAWGNGMEELIANGWTRSDQEMIDVTLPEYLDKTPFSLYYMTVSGHSPYSQDNTMSKKHYDLVKDLPYSENVKCYIACNLELEFAMASTIAMLEEKGIADDTVIVISTDHYPYGLEPSETWGLKNYVAELYGVTTVEEMYRDHNALIIWSGCLEDMDLVVEDPVSSLDILPTLSNLFGLEYDSRLMVGRDVFSQSEPLVFWPLSYSWKTDKGSYNADTGVFTPAEGVTVPEGYADAVTAAVKNKCVYSRAVQYYNYFNVISKLMGFDEDTTAP